MINSLFQAKKDNNLMRGNKVGQNNETKDSNQTLDKVVKWILPLFYVTFAVSYFSYYFFMI